MRGRAWSVRSWRSSRSTELETVGDDASLRLEVMAAGSSTLYPRGETPVPVAGKECIEVTLPGRGRYDENHRPYLDFFGDVVRGGARTGMFLRDDRLMGVPIRGQDIPRPPDTERCMSSSFRSTELSISRFPTGEPRNAPSDGGGRGCLIAVEGPRAHAVAEGRRMSAGSTSPEPPMEARIARLESDVAHLRSDVAEIKADQRSMRDKIDSMSSSLSGRMDSMSSYLSGKMDSMNLDLLEKIADVKDSIAAAKVWALILYFTFASAMLATMARGFGWL